MDRVNQAARIAQILMGGILLVAGLVKVWEPVLFYWQAISFVQLLGVERESWPQVAKAALLIGPLECALGMALVVNWRPREALPAATALMAAFTGLMVHAWSRGATIDCGCFGALVQRGPGEAAVEDAGMLALLAFAWWRMRSRPSPSKQMAGKGVVVVALVVVVVAGLRFFPETDRLETSDLQAGVSLKGLNASGGALDLSKGEYLVELMSPTCGRCADAVPKMNALSEDADLPPVVALTSFGQHSLQVRQFRQRHAPRFDIATISKTDFMRLTWKRGYPRLAHVKDGVVLTVWEHDNMPDVEQLKRSFGS